jgi:hypothetical protein
MRMYIQLKALLVIAMQVQSCIQNRKTLATRTPLQLGAELFGSDSIDADVEMIDVMLNLLKKQVLQRYSFGLVCGFIP